MKHQESYKIEHHSVYREPEGYKKFIQMGSSPLSKDVIHAAFDGYVPGNKIDIVGIDSIANLQAISGHLSKIGGGLIRIFEPQTRHCDSLVYYLNKNSDPFVDVNVYNEKYEELAIKLPGTPSITFVDKTMLHATQPLNLIDALTFGNADRKIVLAGYGDYPAFQHRMMRGKRRGHNSRNDIHDGSVVYSGSCVPVYTLLKKNAEYIYHKKFTVNEGVVIDAMPKRINGVVYERRPIDSIQSAVENSESIFNKRMWVRKRPSKNWVDIPPSIYEALINGLNDLWISSDGALSVEKVGGNDKKFMIGVYDLVEVVVRSKDIDKEKIRNFLPRKFYSSP